MSSSRSSFDPQAFRAAIQGRTRPPSGASSVGSDRSVVQPSSRASSPGLSRSFQNVNLRSPSPPALVGGAAGGGLGGKSNTCFPAMRVTVDNCCGVIKSLRRGLVMCGKNKSKCLVLGHKTNKVDGMPTGDFYALVLTRDQLMPGPFIEVNDCSSEMITLLETTEFSAENWNQLVEEVDKEKATAAEVKVKTEEVEVEEFLEQELVQNEVTSIPEAGRMSDLDNILDEKTLNEAGDVGTALSSIVEFLKNVTTSIAYARMSVEDLKENQGSVNEVIQQIMELSARFSKVTGDREYVINEFGSVAEGLFTIHGEVADAMDHSEGVDIRVQELEGVIDQKIQIAVDETMEVVRKLQEAVNASTQPYYSAPTTETSSDPNVLSSVLDGNGCLIVDLEVVVRGKRYKLSELFGKVLDLETGMADVRNTIDAKGGVKIGNIHFASKNELLEVVKSELPREVKKGTCRLFPDGITLFVANSMNMSASDHAANKKLSDDLSAADVAVILQCRSPLCRMYTGKATAFPIGETIECFKSKEHWDGTGHSGYAKKIKSSAEDNKNQLTGSNLLADCPILGALSSLMATASADWHDKYHKYMADEGKILDNLKLPDDDVCLLFTDVFQLISELFYKQRSGVHQPDDDVDLWERLTTIIWTSLKVHGLMDEFVKAEFRNHPIVQAAFVRFLTTKIGQHSATALVEKLNKADKKLTNVETEARKAVRIANTAQTTADGVSQKLENLRKKNPEWNN